MKRSLLLLGLFVLITLTSLHFASADKLGDNYRLTPAEVEQLAEETVQKLSLEREFQQFVDAKLLIMPLGPGTHSFIVHVQQQSELAGYLIITATGEGGYAVTEYGAGSSPLFSSQFISPDDSSVRLAEHSAQMEYNGSLAYWSLTDQKGEKLYIDASNGDYLPEDISRQSPPLFRRLIGEGITNKEQPDKISLTSAPFNPASNLLWLVSDKLSIKDTAALIDQLEQNQRLVFSAHQNNVWYSGPLAISGYHSWTSSNGKSITFARTGFSENQVRYILTDKLIGKGSFYSPNM
ncbi:hypothetical protein M3231_08835 [Neobacillus mesonae]|nr:hypothetical protein [Neobacillus mesonae]